MSYLVWKLNHERIQQLCSITAFFEFGYSRIEKIEEFLQLHIDLSKIDLEEEGSIPSLYSIPLVHKMVERANELFNHVYEQSPPPESEIDIYLFFEALFKLKP